MTDNELRLECLRIAMDIESSANPIYQHPLNTGTLIGSAQRLFEFVKGEMNDLPRSLDG